MKERLSGTSNEFTYAWSPLIPSGHFWKELFIWK